MRLLIKVFNTFVLTFLRASAALTGSLLLIIIIGSIIRLVNNTH